MSKLSDSIGQFVTVPVSVLKLLPRIGVDGLALFTYLRWRANGETEVAYPKYETITAATTLTRRRIAAAIRSLESAGLLERKRRFGASTLYRLRLPEPLPAEWPAPAPISANGGLMAPISANGGLMERDESISANGGLMAPISANGGLSLVQGGHAIKNSSFVKIDKDTHIKNNKGPGSVERLVKLGCSRKKAQAAVSESPWPADKIEAELEAWLAYAKTPAGAKLDPVLFPYLIAARIKDGSPCPAQEREPGESGEADRLSERYDGYLELIREQGQARPK